MTALPFAEIRKGCLCHNDRPEEVRFDLRAKIRQEQEPKTANALRVVDVPEVLAKELRNFVGGVSGYLFATAQGKPLQRRNVLHVLHSVKRVGFHAFRRFRLTWLRKNAVPKDLERFW